MAQGYIGQNQIDATIGYDDQFQIGDQVTWKSAPGIPWFVTELIDKEQFVISQQNGIQWTTLRKWFKKV